MNKLTINKSTPRSCVFKSNMYYVMKYKRIRPRRKYRSIFDMMSFGIWSVVEQFLNITQIVKLHNVTSIQSVPLCHYKKYIARYSTLYSDVSFEIDNYANAKCLSILDSLHRLISFTPNMRLKNVINLFRVPYLTGRILILTGTAFTYKPRQGDDIQIVNVSNGNVLLSIAPYQEHTICKNVSLSNVALKIDTDMMIHGNKLILNNCTIIDKCISLYFKDVSLFGTTICNSYCSFGKSISKAKKYYHYSNEFKKQLTRDYEIDISVYSIPYDESGCVNLFMFDCTLVNSVINYCNEEKIMIVSTNDVVNLYSNNLSGNYSVAIGCIDQLSGSIDMNVQRISEMTQRKINCHHKVGLLDIWT